MLAIILIVFAAVFKAVADTLQHHYWDSVFRDDNHFDKNFWNPGLSWKTAKKIFKYPVDAWHLSNSFMIVCFVLAAIVNDLRWHWAIQLVVLGLVFNLVFNLFWNKVLKVD